MKKCGKFHDITKRVLYENYLSIKLNSQRNSLKSSGYTCWEKLFDTLYLDKMFQAHRNR